MGIEKLKTVIERKSFPRPSLQELADTEAFVEDERAKAQEKKRKLKEKKAGKGRKGKSKKDE